VKATLLHGIAIFSGRKLGYPVFEPALGWM
jgi:hypothetical protein